MKKVSLMNTLAIMSIFMVSSSTGAITAAIQRMIVAFPGVAVSTIRLAATVPSLAAIIMLFVVAAVAGKIISYRNLVIIGSILMVIGGLIPLFITSSIVLIICSRLFFGFGIGCVGIRNAIVLRTYEESKKASMLGIGVFTTNLTMLILPIIAGFLADIKWNYAFGIYGICIITFLMVTFFLKNPEGSMIEKDNIVKEDKKEKGKISGKVILYAILIFFAGMTIYPIFTTIATFLAMKNFGTAAVAGTIISVFGFGGVLIGPVFGQALKKLKKWTAPIFTILVVLGISLILWGGSLATIYIGTIACGIGWSGFMLSLTTYAGLIATADTVARATTLVLAFGQLGLFLSTYYITVAGKIFNFIGSEVEGTYFGSIVILTVVTVVFAVFKLAPKEKI